MGIHCERDMLRLIVLLKPIPDLSNISISRSQAKIFEKGPRALNPADVNALEAALKVKDEVAAEVLAVSLARSQEEILLRKALAMGADSAFLAADPAFEDGDALSNAYVLGLIIQKLGHYDLLLCGHQSEEGRVGQLGPRLAELLGLPHALSVTGLSIEGKKAIIVQQWNGNRTLEISLPAVVAVREGTHSPRIPPAIKIIKASKEKIQVWGVNDIGGDPAFCGSAGAATQIRRTYFPDE